MEYFLNSDGIFHLKSEKEIFGLNLLMEYFIFWFVTMSPAAQFWIFVFNSKQKTAYFCDVHLLYLLKTFDKNTKNTKRKQIWVEKALSCRADKENADRRRSQKWVKLVVVGKKVIL